MQWWRLCRIGIAAGTPCNLVSQDLCSCMQGQLDACLLMSLVRNSQLQFKPHSAAKDAQSEAAPPPEAASPRGTGITPCTSTPSRSEASALTHDAFHFLEMKKKGE